MAAPNTAQDVKIGDIVSFDPDPRFHSILKVVKYLKVVEKLERSGGILLTFYHLRSHTQVIVLPNHPVVINVRG